MQNNKFAKISILILTVALCACALFAMTVSAEDTAATKPEIISQNVMYTDQFCLMYAVDASTATAPVTLNVYRDVPGVETPVEKAYVVDSSTPASKSGLTKDAYIFTVQGVGATELLSEFYVQAVDADGDKSELKRYSVAEYLYQRLANPNSTDDQKEFYNNTLAFGATAQTLFDTEGTTLITDYRYVTVSDGTINDYINESGVYPLGETITLRDPDTITSTWNVTTTAADGTVTVTENVTDKYVVTDAVKTEFELVSSVSHRQEAATFEDKAAGAAGDFFSTETSTGAYVNDYEYVYEEGRGMILKASLSVPQDSCVAMIKTSTFDTSIATKETATAFEFSFDVKLDFLNDDGTRQYVVPAIRHSGSSQTSRNSFGRDTSKEHLSFLYYGAGNSFADFADVECDDWFHVRMVYYAGDTTRYIYVNGSETPIEMSTGGGNGYTGDITTISRAEFMIERANSAVTIYLDNVFCGYTLDTPPATE